MMPHSDPALIILAAGRSNRMGEMKLLLPLGDRPVIAQVVATALASGLHPVVVVVGHLASQVRAALPNTGETVIENAQYRDGQSTSLHAGLAAVPLNAPGAIVMLGDQPLITASHLTRLAAASATSSAQIIATSVAGRRANPVYFARALFPELLDVSGDSGGREVIARHSSQVVLVELDDPAAALDMDDPDSYWHVRALWDQRHLPS